MDKEETIKKEEEIINNPSEFSEQELDKILNAPLEDEDIGAGLVLKAETYLKVANEINSKYLEYLKGLLKTSEELKREERETEDTFDLAEAKINLAESQEPKV